ncbi:MAG: HAD family hydrolase [Bacteroidota bacterium]|nr:HAD family hydrolase [Bacteroidota bacterium]
MEKAVFFDRDGVINNDTGHYYIYRLADFILNKGVIDALKLLQENGFRLFVISNQGGISKGIYGKDDVEKVHRHMLNEFSKHKINIDEIYYCPHHSDFENCFCRKPGSLMIEKALARFNVDPAKSFLIGDSTRDIKAGERAGLTCILINKNESVLNLCKQIAENGK